MACFYVRDCVCLLGGYGIQVRKGETEDDLIELEDIILGELARKMNHPWIRSTLWWHYSNILACRVVH